MLVTYYRLIFHGISSLPTNIKNFKEASRLGQDTEEVLYELGVSKEKIKHLANCGAIKLDIPVDKNATDNNPIKSNFNS